MSEVQKAIKRAATERSMELLPPDEDKCQECAGDHLPEEPHNPQSLYWQTKRSLAGLPVGTWEDALAHCPPHVKEAWEQMLKTTYGFGCPECGGWKFNKNDYLCDGCRK